MAVILIIEDEPEMAQGLADNLRFEGYQVLLANDGESGLLSAAEHHPQLIILDLMLPHKSGFDVLKELRAKNVVAPIILLTARSQEIDKVLGLELGADDYITKPFSVRELLARIKAVLRRVRETNEMEQKFSEIGKIKVDLDHYLAFENDREVFLTHKEFELLKYFIQHSGKVVSRDDLLNHVWGYDIFPNSRTVDNHIVKLRKKIEHDPNHPKHILTVHGIGYKFIL